MRTLVCLLPFIIGLGFFSTSCVKPNDTTQERRDTTGRVDSLVPVVKNEWQCTIDGTSYNGSIDTSFMQILFSSSSVDSAVAAIGTTADKKAHIHFKVAMNRKNFPGSGVNTSYSFLVFDTSTYNRYTSFMAGSPTMNYKIDTVRNNYLVISFSGTLTDRSGTHNALGKFYCSLNTGDNEPNKYYCLLDSAKRSGYFTNATFSANTLVLNGLDYLDPPIKNFRLVIRTGTTIKPGIYNSRDGGVGLRVYSPGYIGSYFYVDDTTGSIIVTIHSVTGNEVRGSFSGTNKTLNRIDSGSFVCKVSNYVPYNNGPNRWQFSAWVDPVFSNYDCFAGNILNAMRTTSNGRNYLTINGESDNGLSSFKIVISSSSAITRAPYVLNGFPDNVLDTLYFKSAVKTWYGVMPKIWADASTASSGDGITVYIESIDSNGVSGTFYRDIHTNLDDLYYFPSSPRDIQKARFNATF